MKVQLTIEIHKVHSINDKDKSLTNFSNQLQIIIMNNILDISLGYYKSCKLQHTNSCAKSILDWSTSVFPAH